MRRALAATLVGWLAAACSPGNTSERSCEHGTAEISAVAVVLDAGATIRAEIDFEAGDRSVPGAELRLCAEDLLTIEGEQPVETEHPDRVVYSLTIDASSSDRSIDFVLERSDDVLELTVDVPAAFDIVAPTEGQQVPRSSDFVLEWAPPQPEGQIRIGLAEEIGYGICLRTENAEHDYKSADGVDAADDGNWLVPAGVVQADGGAACEASYELERVRAATYPDTLESGGYAEGRVVRSVAFTSVP